MPGTVEESSGISITSSANTWYSDSSPNSKLQYVSQKSLPGFCYLKMVYYLDLFDDSTGDQFRDFIDKFKYLLWKDPVGMDVLTFLARACINRELGKELTSPVEGDESDDRIVKTLYRKLSESEARVQVEEWDGVLHLTGLPSFGCKCQDLVCTHGWTFEAICEVLIQDGKRMGASNFDMDAFLNGGVLDDEEEDFDDVYSSLTVETIKNPDVRNWMRTPPESPEMRKSTPVPQKVTDEEATSSRPVNGVARRVNESLEASLRKQIVLERERRELENKHLQNEVKILRQRQMGSSVERYDLDEVRPLAVSNRSVVSTIVPRDSASVVGMGDRQNRFMHSGSVISPQTMMSSADMRDGRTTLTIGDSLVTGYQMTQESQEIELRQIKRLKPINGLPRPFTNTRLNFLANIHTALERSFQTDRSDLVRCLLRTMRSPPLLPVDDLLHQLLSSSIDRSEMKYVSNGFRLPYVEIGMDVTEDSVYKMFDLLKGEYKQLWFQEMKGLTVPDFHADYARRSQDPVTRPTRRRTEDVTHRDSGITRPRKSRGSILGF